MFKYFGYIHYLISIISLHLIGITSHYLISIISLYLIGIISHYLISITECCYKQYAKNWI